MKRSSTRTEDLYRRHVPDAVRLGTMLTGDAATGQDVAHDAFVKAAAKWTVMRNPDQFGAYLRRTVVRTVLMRRRSVEREDARAVRAHAGVEERERDVGAVVADRLHVADALASLPVRQRAAVVLRYWHDLPEAEIAGILGCAPGTVKSSLARGLDALREVVTADV